MKYSKIEDMPIWKEAMSLVENFYKLAKSNNLLNKDYALLDQMKRSVISILSNISEWFARKTNTEFKRFLDISLWSLSEFKTQIYICEMVWYIEKTTLNEFLNRILSIEKQIKWFIRYLK